MSRRDRISDLTRNVSTKRESPSLVLNARHIERLKQKRIERPAKLPEVAEATFLDIKREKSFVAPARPRQHKSTVLKRQGLKKLPPFVPRKLKKHPAKALVFAGLAIVGLGLGSVLLSFQFKNDHKEQSAVQAATDTKPQASVDLGEQPTKAEHDSYQVSKESPRYLKIPKLQVDSRIKRIQILQDGTLSPPPNINDIGWYESTNLPNTGGTSVMAGYVSSPSKEGVFYRIGLLQVGDTFQVALGDGQLLNYKIAKTKSYDPDKVDMKELLAPVNPAKEGLNLITFSNRFDVRTQKYEQRFVIFAVRE